MIREDWGQEIHQNHKFSRHSRTKSPACPPISWAVRGSHVETAPNRSLLVMQQRSSSVLAKTIGDSAFSCLCYSVSEQKDRKQQSYWKVSPLVPERKPVLNSFFQTYVIYVCCLLNLSRVDGQKLVDFLLLLQQELLFDFLSQICTIRRISHSH